MTSLAEKALPVDTKQLVHPKYRADIDGMRAVAVSAVVIFHAFPSVLPGGFIGVDIFFVISGFLISSIIYGSLANESFSFSKFYDRRIKRIFPALIIILIFSISLGWYVLFPEEYKKLGVHVAGGSGFISNILLWNESGYFDTAAETKPLLHLWSLGIEEQFYIFWPVLLLAARKVRLNLLVAAIILTAVSFYYNIEKSSTDSVSAFYMPYTRAWELLVGSCLAYVQIGNKWLSNKKTAKNNACSIAGILAIVLGFYLTNNKSLFPGWLAALPVIGTALVIAAGSGSWINKNILSFRPIVWIGLISFPIYLWHWPLIVLLKMVTIEPPSVAQRLCVVLSSVILAWATYRAVEIPLRRVKNQNIVTTGLSVTIIIIAFSGLTVYELNGIPSRFPAEIQDLANFHYNPAEGARVGKCWLDASAPYDGFSTECLKISDNTEVKNILIWGDSHAGRLYTGFDLLAKDKYNVMQSTRDACPPILDFGYENCKTSNAYILANIQRVRPQIVILFGAWGRYGTDWQPESEKSTKLSNTIAALSKIGVSKIVVFGPAPEWEDNLPKLVYKGWLRNYPSGSIPTKLNFGLKIDTLAVATDISTLTHQLGVEYFSVYDALCNKDGCTASILGKELKLTSWDYGHLTTDGAEVVARKTLNSGLLR